MECYKSVVARRLFLLDPTDDISLQSGSRSEFDDLWRPKALDWLLAWMDLTILMNVAILTEEVVDSITDHPIGESQTLLSTLSIGNTSGVEVVVNISDKDWVYNV
ncbi:hypothetical protein N7478_003940 [Penicillium angulare]|uniref:uncharacterized protein n=1 Tax=Penicillium angulare TaxID=116970 RepID=UPI0025408714|nr:uncharacterized protein N7478_003940 [Penicillium angulare]KAJ5288254.1 hypothetical protein N7478_003940 [Penicillium angulare]